MPLSGLTGLRVCRFRASVDCFRLWEAGSAKASRSWTLGSSRLVRVHGGTRKILSVELEGEDQENDVLIDSVCHHQVARARRAYGR